MNIPEHLRSQISWSLTSPRINGDFEALRTYTYDIHRLLLTDSTELESKTSEPEIEIPKQRLIMI